MSADLSDLELSYSRRLCRRCRTALVPQRGFLGRTAWRCERCRPPARRAAMR